MVGENVEIKWEVVYEFRRSNRGIDLGRHVKMADNLGKIVFLINTKQTFYSFKKMFM